MLLCKRLKKNLHQLTARRQSLIGAVKLVGFGQIFYIRGMNRLKHFIEWQVFGVCTAIGERMGIATSRIRTWFIYISFLTMGSPLIIYFILAFWMNIKRYILSARRNPLKYL